MIDYEGGVPAKKPAPPKTVIPGVEALTPEQDFSPTAAARRELQKQLSSRREQSDIQAKIDKITAPGAPVSRVGNQYMVNYYKKQADELVQQGASREKKYDISNYPSTKAIVSAAESSGAKLTDDDISNLIDWSILNDAADTVIAGVKAGDPNVAKNVQLTLEKTNFAAASILPDLINEKISASIEDPTLAQQAVDKVLGFVGWLSTPLMAANEWTGEGMKAGNYRAARSPLGETPLSWVPLAQGFISGDDREATAAGKLNEERIQGLRDAKNADGTPVYSPLQIDIVTELVRLESKGEPDPIKKLWGDKYKGNLEAAKVFGDLAYAYSTGNTQELYRQVQAANPSNLGQSLLGSAVPDSRYDPARGSVTHASVADVVGGVTSFVYDPTNLVFGAGRAFQAARWALTRLEPTAEAAETVLKGMKIGKVTVQTPASRFFSEFTKDLNKLDELTARASKAETDGLVKKATSLRADAAALRNRMTRQYDEMPEQLIEDFRNEMPRNADGKFDVQSAAKWIDSTNEAFRIRAGDAAQQLRDIAAADATKRAALLEAMKAEEAGSKGFKKAKEAIDELDAETAAKIDPINKDLQAAWDKTFASRVRTASQRGEALVPRMSMLGALRKNAVNSIKVSQMQSKAVDSMIAKYLPRLEDSSQFADDLATNANDLGSAVRDYRMMQPIDTVGRMFSSLPDVSVLSVWDASSTRAFYRMSRAFLPKRVSQLMAEEWRKGTPASRRKMVTGLVRSSAAVRGVELSADDAEALVTGALGGTLKDKVTGLGRGERYGVTIQGSLLPSERAAAADAAKASGIKLVEQPVVEGQSLSLSSDANGIQHALHMEDTADYVRIPSMQDFEDLRKEMGLAAQGYYYGGRAAQGATNVWSFLTLYGPRFSLRNAIEEDGLYLAMGYSPALLAKGRAADQMIRRARPRLSPKLEKQGNRLVPKIIDGEPQITRKSSLGMIANKAEWISLKMKAKGVPDWISEFVYNSVDTKQAVLAAQQRAAGKPEAFMDLLVQAQVAHKLGLKNLSMLSDDQMKIVQYLAGSQHGMQLYDQVGEAGHYLSNGSFPDFIMDTESIDVTAPGVVFGKVKAKSNLSLGDYQNVRPVQVDPTTGNKILGVSFWWEQLRKTLETDGPIGEAAVVNLSNPAVAKQTIADIIRNDKDFGYMQRLSRITDDMAIDEFANSYFENVFQHFTREDGTLNTALQRKFLFTEPETGKLRAAFWTPSAEDSKDLVYRVRMSDLEDFPSTERPQFVFGRAVEETPWVPIAENESAFWSTDRGFAWMGRQNARISKGPIFLAHLMDNWSQTAPARTALAKSIAEAAGREVPDAADIELAEKLYAKQAMDAAYNLTVSYVDNPANRSNIAWKARNVSRYYRATEDFWRRMKRVAANKPETFWKVGLTYHILTDTGFVFEDDNGDAYFGYPGSDILQETVSNALAFMGGPKLMNFMNMNPFLITGKITGLTPSSDPNQQLPSVSGPAAIGLTAIYDMFPTLFAMKGLQRVTLGEYATVSGNLLEDVIKMATPAGVTRALNTTNPDQLDASLAQGGMDAVNLMAAEGLLEKVTINGKEMPGYEIGNASQFRQTDQYKAGQFIAWGLVTARTIISTMGAASPQVMSNTVSKEARDLGITGMKPLYRELLDLHQDDPDPYASAISEFMAMQAKKMFTGEQVSMQSFLPFTTSSYTDPSESADDNVAALAKIQTGVEGLTKWWQSDETRDLVRNGYRNAALFLAPQKGKFNFGDWNLVKNDLGLKVKKNEDQMIEDLISIQGKQMDTTIRRSYEELIANIDPSDPNAAELKSKYSQDMENERKINKSMYPAWDLVSGQGNSEYKQSNYRAAFSDVRGMLTYMKKRDGELTGTAAGLQSAIDIFLYYQGKKSAIAGSSQQRSSAKQQLDAEMQSELINLKKFDPTTTTFIESVIDNIGYDPMYPAFGGN